MARRIRPVIQLSQADCGAACLAMVSAANGGGGSLTYWRDALGSGRDGASVEHLLRTAGRRGLLARAFAIDASLGTVLASAALPAVLHVDGNHFLVVTRLRHGRVDVIDPRIGRRRLDIAELAARVSGPILLFRRSGPVGDVRAKTAVRTSLAGLVLRSVRGLRLQLLVATALIAAATLAPALLVLIATNQVLRPQGHGVPPTYFVAVLLCLGVQFLGTLLQSALVLRLQTRMSLRLMAAFVRNLLAKDLGFLEQRAAGDILSRIASNSMLQQTLSGLLLSVGLFLPLTAVYLAGMFAISVQLTLLVLVGAALQGVLVMVFGRRIETSQREALRADSELQINSFDTVSNYAVIKSMGIESGIAGRWLAAFSDSSASRLRRDSESQALQASIGLVQIGLPIMMVFTGALLYRHGVVQLGDVLAMVTIIGVFLSTFGRLSNGLQNVYLIRGHLERLSDIIDIEGGTSAVAGRPEPERESEPEQQPEPSMVGAPAGLRLSEVSFRYASDGIDIVRDASLTVEPGEMLGIGGSTGSGKTTLIHLLLGLYQPTGGEVLRRRGGVPDSHREVLRYAYVPQDPELFSGSIRENVLAWRGDAEDTDVWRALELALLRGEVERMPLGLDTPIGNRGIHVSGGQRQRLALARAFLRPPDLLVADEPTGHLDPETEAAILRSLREFRCTRIVVAHSERVLRACDRSLVLTHGRLRAVDPLPESSSLLPTSSAGAAPGFDYERRSL